MPKALRIALGLVVLLGAGLPVLARLAESGGAAHAASNDSWTFDLNQAQDLRRGDSAESMAAFLFQVDTDGSLTLERSFRLDGTPPVSREIPDWGRTYEWRLLDDEGRVLRRGRHFDRLAEYTSNPEGGCDKSLMGAHAMMLRVPDAPRATRVEISIVGLRTDREEG